MNVKRLAMKLVKSLSLMALCAAVLITGYPVTVFASDNLYQTSVPITHVHGDACYSAPCGGYGTAMRDPDDPGGCVWSCNTCGHGSRCDSNSPGDIIHCYYRELLCSRAGASIGNISLVVSNDAVATVSTTGISDVSYAWNTGSTSNTLRFTGSGTYSCTVTFKDSYGGQYRTQVVSYTFTDNTPPVVSDVSVSNERARTNIVTVTATDNISVSEYKLNDGSWQTSSSFTITENGDYTVYAKDAAGNISTGYAFTVNNLDNAAPTLNFNYSTTEWTNSTVGLNIESVDQASPGGSTGTVTVKIIDDNGTEYALDHQFAENISGTITSTDDVGNSTSLPFLITWIDTTAPTADIAANLTTPTNTDVVLTLSGADTQSGLPTDCFSWDSVHWSDEASVTVEENGTYTGYIRDAVGNMNSADYIVSNIDKTFSKISVTPDISDWTTSNYDISIEFTDDYQLRRVFIDNRWFNLDAGQLPNNVTVTKDENDRIVKLVANRHITENCKLEFKAVDYAENVTSESYEVVNIDRIRPELSLSVTPNWETNTNVGITVTARDNYGEIKGITLPDGRFIDGSSTEYVVSCNGVYTFKVTDKAGNTVEESSFINNIDKTAPNVTIRLSKNNGNWISGSITLTIHATDTHPDFEYILKNGDNVQSNKTGVFEITENGTYIIEVVDGVGNRYIETIVISNIDSTSPVISVSLKHSYWVDSKNTLVINSTDDLSGVSMFSLDNINWQYGNEFDVSYADEYTIYVKDNAGNVNSVTVHFAYVEEPEEEPLVEPVVLGETIVSEESVSISENEVINEENKADDTDSGTGQPMIEIVNEVPTETPEEVNSFGDMIRNGLTTVGKIAVKTAPYVAAVAAIGWGLWFAIRTLKRTAKVYGRNSEGEWKFVGIVVCKPTTKGKADIFGYTVNIRGKLLLMDELKLVFGSKFGISNKGCELTIHAGSMVIMERIDKKVVFSLKE